MKIIINKIAIIAFFTAILFSISGCSSAEYKTSKKIRSIKIQSEEISPNGIYKVYSYIFTDGGMTVPFRRGVSIIKVDEENPEEILAENKPNIYLNNNSSNEAIEIKWIDNENLMIDFNNVKENESYINLKVDIFEGIKINYENLYM